GLAPVWVGARRVAGRLGDRHVFRNDAQAFGLGAETRGGDLEGRDERIHHCDQPFVVISSIRWNAFTMAVLSSMSRWTSPCFMSSFSSVTVLPEGMIGTESLDWRTGKPVLESADARWRSCVARRETVF